MLTPFSVCGSVLGDGYSDKMGGRIQGTAPKATLVMQSLLDGAGYLSGIPDDLHNLFEPPYKEHDARIHTNSWGSSPRPWYQIKYDDSAKEIDDFVYTHRDMVILFAAGNDGMDVKPKDGAVDLAQIGSQAAAKNCISVGASESIRPELNRKYSMWGYPKQPLAGDNVANDAEGMAAFSSRGPTVEGRIKPDVVAPGTCILSTRSSVAEDSGGWGKSTDDRFCFEGGTSMATPLVAGCCAVLRESLVKNGVPAPSAALIKALLINGAVELAGQYNPSEAGPSPNFASGWGRVDVANSLVVPADDAPVTGPAAATTPSPIRVSADGTAGFADESAATAVDTFEEFTFTITIKAPASGTVRPPTNGQAKDVAARGPGSVAAKAVQTPALKVTLVWTDPAGEKLQNDLDLIVVAGDVERHGNQGTKTFPVKTKKDRDDEDHAITTPAGHAKEPFDRRNNVEQVVWANIPEGDVTVIVRGHNVTSLDGQTFAVAWKVYY